MTKIGQFEYIVTLSCVAFAVLAGSSGADSLRATSLKETYELFEPVVLEVTLVLDQPYEVPKSKPEVRGKDFRLHRDLDAELRSEGRTVCRAILGGVAFRRIEPAGKELHARVLGLLGELTPEGAGSVFRFWNTPGIYKLLVVDHDNRLESAEISISIVAGSPETVSAAELFQSGGIKTFAAFYGAKDRDVIRPRFQQLATNYADTIYGKYASTFLALWDAEATRGGSGDEDAKVRSALADELKRVADFFAPGHPLRSRALLQLARIQPSQGIDDAPRATIQQLMRETRDGYTIEYARQFLDNLDRARRHTTYPSSDENAPHP